MKAPQTYICGVVSLVIPHSPKIVRTGKEEKG